MPDTGALHRRNEAVAEGLAYWVKRCPRLAWYFRILYQRYGCDAHTICAEAMAIHKGLDPDPRAEPIRAEVRYVCRNEMVCTLEDLLERRAGFLHWNLQKRLERALWSSSDPRRTRPDREGVREPVRQV